MCIARNTLRDPIQRVLNFLHIVKKILGVGWLKLGDFWIVPIGYNRGTLYIIGTNAVV